MNDHLDLNQRLRDLAAAVRPPAVPLADDLARGRTRLRRQRVMAGAGVVAAIAVIGLAGTVGPGLVSAGEGPGYSGGDGTPLPGPETTPPLRPDDRVVPLDKGDVLKVPPQVAGDMDFSDNETLRLYNDVLAEHLDPDREHLVRKVSNVQSGSDSGAMSLGSKFSWRNRGEDGLGMLQISVNSGWQMTGWMCGMPQVDWTCRDITAPGDLDGEVAEHDGVTEVAVEHPDDTVVVLTVDTLFGNNSTVPVSEIDLTPEDLAAAAADDRLKLPGLEGDVPESLSQQKFSAAGVKQLAAAGDTFVKGYGGNDVQPYQEATWSDGTNSGELLWDALAQTEPTGEYGCLKVQFTRCVVREVDGHDVLVGYVRNKWGGGVQVIYAGPSYEVRVVFEPDAPGDEFPIDRAAQFVIDERWQP